MQFAGAGTHLGLLDHTAISEARIDSPMVVVVVMVGIKTKTIHENGGVHEDIGCTSYIHTYIHTYKDNWRYTHTVTVPVLPVVSQGTNEVF